MKSLLQLFSTFLWVKNGSYQLLTKGSAQVLVKRIED